jgi:hypothetical protein
MASKTGPGSATKKGRSAGRVTGRHVHIRENAPDPNARYTPPIPKKIRRSPSWMGPTIIGILVLGVLMIILNYTGILPASPTNWYLLGGIALFFIGAIGATRYH